MEAIPEALVEKTWQEVTGFSPGSAKKEMTNIGKTQLGLLAIMMQLAEEMGQEMRELAKTL